MLSLQAKTHSQMTYKDIANQLEKVEQELETKKLELKPLEDAKEALRTSLIDALKRAKLRSVGIEGGNSYVIARRTNITVADEIKANKWGVENGCVRLDLVKAKKILIHEVSIPDGFITEETEYISVKKNNDNS